MNRFSLIFVVCLTGGLAACQKPAPAPAPVVIETVPGPAGQPGATGATGATGSTGTSGMDGAKGDPGKTADGTTVIVLPPAASAPKQ